MLNEPHITEYFGGRRVDSKLSWIGRFVAWVDGDKGRYVIAEDRNEAVLNALAAFPEEEK